MHCACEGSYEKEESECDREICLRLCSLNYYKYLYVQYQCKHFTSFHTLCVHYAHAAPNLIWLYTKVSPVHYFCTFALAYQQTTLAVLTRMSRRIDSFAVRVTVFC